MCVDVVSPSRLAVCDTMIWFDVPGEGVGDFMLLSRRTCVGKNVRFIAVNCCEGKRCRVRLLFIEDINYECDFDVTRGCCCNGESHISGTSIQY